MPSLYQEQVENNVSNLLRFLNNTAFPGQAQPNHADQLRYLFDEQLLTHMTSYAPELPESSIVRWLMDSRPTGSLVVNQTPSKETLQPKAPRISSDQVRLITSFIGLGKSQVATIFGVSRQTLYDWLKGKIEPTGANANRVSMLSRSMAPACQNLRRPLYHGYITESLHQGEISILALLKQETWSERELAHAFEQARLLTDEREQQLGLSGPTTSRKEGDNYQLDNSIAFGLE